MHTLVRPRRRSIVLVLAVLAVLVAPAIASAAVVKGPIVKCELDESRIVVKNAKTGDEVTLKTTPRTSVNGLGGPSAVGVDALRGLEGTHVTVKYREDADNEATFVRVHPHKKD